MTDEEKKAIDELITRREYFEYNQEGCNHHLSFDKWETEEIIDTILNLIEKQSKEIEELKAISEYREKIIKGLGLKTLPKTITGFRELIENNDKKWEDKIKAKIEEVQKRLKEETRTDFLIILKILENELQSLLEKE